jgi:hypothetical protein
MELNPALRESRRKKCHNGTKGFLKKEKLANIRIEP